MPSLPPAAPSATDLLSRLVAYDTTSRNANMALIDFIASFLGSHGVRYRLGQNEARPKAKRTATNGPNPPRGKAVRPGGPRNRLDLPWPEPLSRTFGLVVLMV